PQRRDQPVGAELGAFGKRERVYVLWRLHRHHPASHFGCSDEGADGVGVRTRFRYSAISSPSGFAGVRGTTCSTSSTSSSSAASGFPLSSEAFFRETWARTSSRSRCRSTRVTSRILS